MHGKRAEARKVQVKDVSVSNVHQHKEGEGGERTRTTAREARVRSG